MGFMEKQSIEITSRAMDGLSARHKAISSNIANANTADYKKIEVAFEGQLRKIIRTENIQEQNRLNPNNPLLGGGLRLDKNALEMSDFMPTTFLSKDPVVNSIGNNVNIESEMSELAKNGMKYNALATIQAKAFRGMQEIIKGR